MHFCVYVIGNEDLDSALEPFQENNMGNVNEQYLDFIDRTDEVRKEWKDFPLTALADHSSAKDYKNIEEFAKDWFGYETQDGKFGYTDNPNAKWDWWVLGGRWAGHLPLKSGKMVDQAYIEDIDLEELRTTSGILYRGTWQDCSLNPWVQPTDAEEAGWLAEIKALFSDLPPGTLVSVVDCHI